MKKSLAFILLTTLTTLNATAADGSGWGLPAWGSMVSNITGIFSQSGSSSGAAPVQPCQIEVKEEPKAPETPVVPEGPLTDAVFARTDQKWVDQIYDTLEIIDEVFRDNNIKYSLIGGTLLGAVRHGGIIPWDDDGDIAILQDDVAKIKSLLPEFEKRGYTMRWWPGGFQIYPKKDVSEMSLLERVPFVGENISMLMYGNHVPFVDLFPMTEREPGKLKYARYFSYKNWPKEYISLDQWNSMVDVPFGHLNLMGPDPKTAKEFLDRSYGNNWNEISYKTFDHVTLKSSVRKEVKIVDRGHTKRSPKN